MHTVFLVILPKLHALSGDCFPFTESRSEENLNRPWYNYCAFPSPSPAAGRPGNSAHYSAEDLGSQASNVGLFSHSGPRRRSRQGTRTLCFHTLLSLGHEASLRQEEASVSGPSSGRMSNVLCLLGLLLFPLSFIVPLSTNKQ